MVSTEFGGSSEPYRWAMNRTNHTKAKTKKTTDKAVKNTSRWDVGSKNIGLFEDSPWVSLGLFKFDNLHRAVFAILIL